MRSMESWTHFVVSPIHTLVQNIHCGIVLRHIHSDGWMLMLMFQTTEHHSQHHIYLFIFYGLLRNTPESCDGSTLLIPLWFMQWKCMFQGKSVFIIISAFSCNYSHPMRLFITNILILHLKRAKVFPQGHTCRCTIVTHCFSHLTTMQRPSFLTQRWQNNRGARQQHSGCHWGHIHNTTCIFVSGFI